MFANFGSRVFHFLCGGKKAFVFCRRQSALRLRSLGVVLLGLGGFCISLRFALLALCLAQGGIAAANRAFRVLRFLAAGLGASTHSGLFAVCSCIGRLGVFRSCGLLLRYPLGGGKASEI